MGKVQKNSAVPNFDGLQKVPFPGFVNPMLATLTDDYFDDPHWIYERKLDGIRCLVTIENGNVNLYSRNENNINQSYPELKAALKAHPYPNLIADGEIVAFDGKTTSFQKLQNRIQLKDSNKIAASNVTVFLYLFDILYLDGYDLTQLPQLTRKNVLKKTFEWSSPLRYTSHRKTKGTEFLKEACEKGWEGLIAKNSKAVYVHSRSRNWLKFKCSLGQELVIGGFTEPQGERIGFGALLVGYYKGKDLMFAGKVGTGFDDAFLSQWRDNFDKIERETSPFINYKDKKHGKNHWVTPQYIGQFAFTEWTKTNKLRHPRFLGMREDKDPLEVVKEK